MSPTPAADLFDHFRVDLDAGVNPLFKGGERITGNVRIKLKKEVTIEVIRIQFKGRALQKESKKGRDVEKIFFDKDYVLLERPPGNVEPGNFTWKADFDYSLPFQYILPLGCPSSFEGPDGFVRYFTRVTLETTESKAVYVAKKHFSVYDLDTVAAIDPHYQEPYTYRHTFSSGGCCCKRQVYFEFVMPKRVFVAGEDIEGRMIVDGIADERIANDIQYSIVERTVKPEINDEEALKYPARVIKSAKIDGSNVEKRKNQIVIGSLLIPAAAPVSLPNAVALATLPKDKTSPHLSPDDQVSKLFEHESIISQSRKEPIFRVHYALQLLIGKFIVEVPFVLKPVESEDVRNALKSARVSQGAAENVALTNAQVAHLNSKEKSPFAEPEENNMIFADIPINFVPVVPVYVVKPADDHAYSWPQLGTYGANQKLIWHPDKKLTKEQKSEQDRLKKEAQEAKKRQQAEEREAKKQAKKQKKPDKELLIVTGEPEANSMSVNVESVAVDNALTPVPSQSAVAEAPSPSASKQQEPIVPESTEVAVTNKEEKPKKKTRAEIRAEKAELKRVKREEQLAEKQRKKDEILAEKQRKKDEILAEKQRKEAEKREAEQRKIDEKREAEQRKIDEKNAKKQAQLAEKQHKKDEAERKKLEKQHAQLEAKNKKKAENEPLVDATADAPGPSDEATHVESTLVITETIVEQHGNEEPTVSVTRTVTERKDGEEPITTTIELTGNRELLADIADEVEKVTFEPQPITEEFVSNGHHPVDDRREVVHENGTNGHHEEISHENGTNGTIDGETNGHVNEREDTTSLKKKKNAAENELLQTEA